MGVKRNVQTVARALSRRPTEQTGPDSRRFYPPLSITVVGQQVCVSAPDESTLTLWPEEAQALALALLRAEAGAEVERLEAAVAALAEERDRKQDALVRYGSHSERCQQYQHDWRVRFHDGPEPTCLCGFDAALAGPEAHAPLTEEDYARAKNDMLEKVAASATADEPPRGGLIHTPTKRVMGVDAPDLGEPIGRSCPACVVCPKGEGCALNAGAVHCKHCGRNWPPDETWDRDRAALVDEPAATLAEPGSSAADVDGTTQSRGHHESVGERQGRQPGSASAAAAEPTPTGERIAGTFLVKGQRDRAADEPGEQP